MTSLLSLTLIHITCAFLLGLILGWLIWSLESTKGRKSLMAEVEFWKSHLEQARMKRDESLNTIENLMKEKQNLKKRLDSKAS